MFPLTPVPLIIHWLSVPLPPSTLFPSDSIFPSLSLYPYIGIYLSLPVSIRTSESTLVYIPPCLYPYIGIYLFLPVSPYIGIYISLSVSLSVPLNLSVPLWSQGRVEQWFYRRVEEWRRGRVHNASNLSPSRSAQHWFFSPTLTHIVRQHLFFLNSAIARQVFWTERIAIAQKEETSACPPLLSIYLST